MSKLKSQTEGAQGPTPSAMIRRVMIFVASFVLGMAVIGPTPAPPDGLQQKLELLERVEGADLVFVGSSRTHFQFMPSAFDAEAERLGLHVRSFNAGLPGAAGHEIDYILEKYILPLPTLKYVFIEFPGFEYQIEDVYERTYRKIYWHDVRRTVDAVGSSLKGRLDPSLRLGEVEEHLLHFVLRFCALWPASDEAQLAADARGYGEWTRDGTGESKDSPRGRAGHANPAPAEFFYVNEAVLRRLSRELRARGIELYFVMPPGCPMFKSLTRMQEAGEIPAVFALNDPKLVPELYAEKTAGGYLRLNGARMYSELLARKFSEARGQRETRSGPP